MSFRISECCFLSIPKEGRRLVWEITQYCPYSCPYCFTWSSPKRKKLEVDINQLMPKIMGLIEKASIKEVLLTGGEPLAVLTKVTPLLSYLKSKNIPFSISTNLCNEKIFSELYDYGLKTVNLSIDPPTNLKDNKDFKADYERIDRNLQLIQKIGIDTKLTAVVSEKNYKNIPKLINQLTGLTSKYKHIRKVAFNREYPIGYASESKPLTKKKLQATYSLITEWATTLAIPIALVNWSEFNAPLQECPAGSNIISVQQDGDVTPCSLLYNLTRSLRAGNLLIDPIDTIINRLNTFVNDLGDYYQKTEQNTPECITCELKGECGGGCLAMHAIASNHIQLRTCSKNPVRILNHERVLLSEFHHKYHEVYSPEDQKFAAPQETLGKDLEQRIRKYVQSKITQSDLAHSMEHIDVVVRLTKHISKEERASQKITIPAAYFHDAAPREASMHHMHTYKAAALAGNYLKKLDTFTDEEIKHIQYCIITSSYGSFLLGYQALSLEAKVVRDADWLDSIGARGIARVFTFAQAHNSTKMGNPIYNPEELPITIDMNITGPDDSPIYHFYTKLLKIAPLLQTPTGKQLGKERNQYLIDFIKQYRKEVYLNEEPQKQLPIKFNYK